jgi:hypothetical protein
MRARVIFFYLDWQSTRIAINQIYRLFISAPRRLFIAQVCVAKTARRSRRTLRAHGEETHVERSTLDPSAIILTDNGAIKRGASGGTNDAIFPVGLRHTDVDATRSCHRWPS